MKSKMLRRTFLAMAAASPFALSSCASRSLRDGSSEAELERDLRRLIYAVGPWTENDANVAEDFFERFWSYMPASDAYVQDMALVGRLSRRFPEGSHASPGIRLTDLPSDEKDLLVQLTDGLYSLFEIRAYLGDEPQYGVCLPDRMGYTRAPEPK
jgi:hypothetical protein